ncbi:MAG: HesA/MoeB/ThiF family protein [Acidobacteriota bacterium]|jgi:adenylyltransferase/sulfurtransferase|nr:HesA/MoeB/ThiF family protein [Acidobacteriota bacterium]NLT32814.1 HesA/MoeB/ThiF family protein [Acidobacteriota bacterium]
MTQSGERYARQLALLGAEGQEKLARARVLVVGAGGLGSPLLFYLAAAGVGTLTFVDEDRVAESNLNRQILYAENDLCRPKAGQAAERLAALNRTVRLTPIAARFTGENGPALVAGSDLVALALDNRETRLLANRLCVAAGRPLVDGGIDGWGGYVTTVVPGSTPCLSCWFEKRKPGGRAPVSLGPMAGVIGSMEALAVLQMLLGRPGPAGRLMLFDGSAWTLSPLVAGRRPDCPTCGNRGEAASS